MSAVIAYIALPQCAGQLRTTSRRNTQRFLVNQDLTSLNQRLSKDTKNR
jgi:hypothetical protein